MDSSVEQQQNLLSRARFEVLPLRGTAEKAEELPAGTTVTVTSSPAKGTEATLDLAARLRSQGLHVVPHLAARLVLDGAQLADLLDRMDGLGLTEAFVIAGDADQPAGDFPDALALLRGMEELGRRPHRVGITGYPEPHAFISDDSTIRAMTEKARYADYIVSQICYDPHTIIRWAREIRDRGVLLPVHIGIPGAVDVTKLLRVSLKIGLGESMRFLRKQHGVVTRLLSRYTPDELVEELSPHLLEDSLALAGWHVFTFNEIVGTVRWRDDLITRLQEVPA